MIHRADIPTKASEIETHAAEAADLRERLWLLGKQNTELKDRIDARDADNSRLKLDFEQQLREQKEAIIAQTKGETERLALDLSALQVEKDNLNVPLDDLRVTGRFKVRPVFNLWCLREC